MSDGSSAAGWRRLIEEYAELLWGMIDAEGLEGEDAAAAWEVAWLRLADRVARILPIDQAPAWLAGAVGRVAHETRVLARRQGHPGSRDVDIDLTATEGPRWSDPDVGRAPDVLRAFRALSPRCRLLLHAMAQYEPFTYRQLSVVLDMPIGSIGPTRGRCLEYLQRELARIAVDDGASR